MTYDEKFLHNIIMELKEITKDVAKLEIKNAQCLEALAILKQDEKMFLAEHDENVRLHFENVELQEQNARLREALKVYADLEYWRAVQGDDQEYLFCESISQKTYVQGKRARAAMVGKE
jgi:hypothetical protein